MDVSTLKATEAVEPVPEYITVTYVAIVPDVVLLPIVLANEHSENEHEVLGKLKN